ncbi:MAG: hypothetical protein DMG97_22955 [Acidobacteria bacterium]|nr:MAG: hypothetical protein DMG98_07445 [Acidobacteriota bacterium]PYV69059.1 MAG: hypothetical protein DMG97_22955 [Acidobacteriota bacterium]PYV69342.1 MAG: hypothetical protein DMG96_34280 [Acidobacteriota bacterium]
MASLVTKISEAVQSPSERSKFAYKVMLAFSFLYYLRPSDVIPGLRTIPLAKITGAIAILALLLGGKKGGPKKLPFEVKLLFAMFCWLILTVPFSSWRGNSLQVVVWQFSKTFIIPFTLVMTVSRMRELRRLIFVQAAGVALMTMVSVLVNTRWNGRLAGIGNGLLSNPNDLAMNIALNWPICLVFLLTARGMLKKILWGMAILTMIYAVMATYSRAGFLALSMAIALCLWEFALRGRRIHIIAVATLCVLLSVFLAPQNYSKRLETLVGQDQAGDKDRGSAAARRALLIESLKVTATHPVFGVGPGNFSSFTSTWMVTHNTYTEFSAECGIPALVMFLVLLQLAFRNVRRVRKSKLYDRRSDVQMFAGALWASLVAYLIGASFASTAYSLFPYYMVTYTILLAKIAFPPVKERFGVAVKPVQVEERIYSPV